MPRVKTSGKAQKNFLNTIAENMSFGLMAKHAGINKRTLFDWRREKYQMNYEALRKLSAISGVPIPGQIKILPDYWSVRKAGTAGAIKRNAIYGNPGTFESRSRGGRATILK